MLNKTLVSIITYNILINILFKMYVCTQYLELYFLFRILHHFSIGYVKCRIILNSYFNYKVQGSMNRSMNLGKNTREKISHKKNMRCEICYLFKIDINNLWFCINDLLNTINSNISLYNFCGFIQANSKQLLLNYFVPQHV